LSRNTFVFFEGLSYDVAVDEFAKGAFLVFLVGKVATLTDLRFHFLHSNFGLGARSKSGRFTGHAGHSDACNKSCFRWDVFFFEYMPCE
jgi:hypothetical protein